MRVMILLPAAAEIVAALVQVDADLTRDGADHIELARWRPGA